ncbi:MAG TPA: FGGY-family carbohydrate kinase, partial [Candidatus Saccharimonadia bacterium]|nr:FGGY-family carbohydrate kinase [Candidatus Saccharimonadia bacterium]
LMQFQADLLGVPVVRPMVTETTALGAAYLAGLAVGFWKNTGEISGQWQVDKTFEPKMPKARVQELRARWNEALERSKGWEKSDSSSTSKSKTSKGRGKTKPATKKKS